MTLDLMCQEAARLADRYDEFEKTEVENPDTGRTSMQYEDDALNYFNVFRDAINEAYHEVARNYGKPDTYQSATVNADGAIDLMSLDPQVGVLKNVLDAAQEKAVPYVYHTRYELKVAASPGTPVTLYYQYLPDRLTGYSDEPIFPESLVDPMVYITLAVARIWLSEKKIELYHTWMNQYYMLLKQCRADLRSRSSRRIPRRQFR